LSLFLPSNSLNHCLCFGLLLAYSLPLSCALDLLSLFLPPGLRLNLHIYRMDTSSRMAQ
jgi:hypothetical protein